MSTYCKHCGKIVPQDGKTHHKRGYCSWDCFQAHNPQGAQEVIEENRKIGEFVGKIELAILAAVIGAIVGLFRWLRRLRKENHKKYVWAMIALSPLFLIVGFILLFILGGILQSFGVFNRPVRNTAAECQNDRNWLSNGCETILQDRQTPDDIVFSEESIPRIMKRVGTNRKPKCPDGGKFSFVRDGDRVHVYCSVHDKEIQN